MSYDYDINVDDAVGSKIFCDSIGEFSEKDNITLGVGTINIDIADKMGVNDRAINLTTMIAFAIEPIVYANSENVYDFNLTTKFKNDTGCKGAAFTQTCTLNQGIVEYSIIFKNNSISLRYPHWQNDSFLEDVSSELRARARLWNNAFLNLYAPVRLVQTWTGCGGNFGFTDWMTLCSENEIWNNKKVMDCYYELNKVPMTFRDSLNFEIGKGSNACEKTWRNPMQVRKTIFLSSSSS